MARAPWWRDAVVYEIYVRSFADCDGDGVGDLPGIRERLRHLSDLGVDAIWLTPFYPSPQADHGYDVADYRGVEPLFGTLTDFDELLRHAHELGLRMIIDIVPNHTSSQHAWFRSALVTRPGSRERARYYFRPGRGRSGDRPPNNWTSHFGGPAWTRVPDGEWYLHLFDAGQPDLDWTNPEVGDEFESVLRFWLDRGVDGFRVDVANGLAKAEGLPDTRRDTPLPFTDQPAVHDVYRRWRRVLDSYAGDRMAVVEAWSDDAELRARYTRPDELHQAFNFHFQVADWSAAAFRRVIEDGLTTTSMIGAAPTWVLSSHDQPRHVSRYGGGEVGLARARAATLLMLALPGSGYLYQGEELGLPQVDVAPEHRQDPTWARSGYTDVGRDGSRVPIPWSGSAAPYGFRAGFRRHLAAPAGRLGTAHGLGPDRTGRLDAGVLPGGVGAAPRAPGRPRRAAGVAAVAAGHARVRTRSARLRDELHRAPKTRHRRGTTADLERCPSRGLDRRRAAPADDHRLVGQALISGSW